MKAVMTDDKCSKNLLMSVLIVISQVMAVCFETHNFRFKSKI